VAYHLVYDVAQAGYSTSMLVVLSFSSLLTALGAGLIHWPALTATLFEGKLGLDPGEGPRAGRIFAWFFFLFALCITLLVGGLQVLRHAAFADASIRNTCSTVEGTVANYARRPDMHDAEQFTVSGVPFIYTDQDPVGGGYSTTASRGGPMREGLRVRICYLAQSGNDGNVILRLETSP
jgi:hypothetical protein